MALFLACPPLARSRIHIFRRIPAMLLVEGGHIQRFKGRLVGRLGERYNTARARLRGSMIAQKDEKGILCKNQVDSTKG